MVVDLDRNANGDEQFIMAVENNKVTINLEDALPKRKLIAAPKFNFTDEFDDEDDDDFSASTSPCFADGKSNGFSLPTVNIEASTSKNSDEKSNSTLSRMAFDLANYGGGSSVPERRHSINLCENPSLSRSSSVSSPVSPLQNKVSNGEPEFSSSSQTQREFLSSFHFSNRLDCLSLTLEEVVHIRNVLTKADLESLPLELSIKEDMAKGKICFMCMKTRFSFFGPRGQECRLCRRIVCKKCVTKMRIPTEHFSNIPVQMLTPQSISPSNEDETAEHSLLPKALLARLSSSVRKLTMSQTDLQPELIETRLNLAQDLQRGSKIDSLERRKSVGCGSVGSAPSSPTGTLRSCRSAVANENEGGPVSLPMQAVPYVGEAIKKKTLSRSNTVFNLKEVFGSTSHFLKVPKAKKQKQRTNSQTEKLRGELMCVCFDCKAMVLHILMSIRALRERQAVSLGGGVSPLMINGTDRAASPRHLLQLKLTPVYQ